MELFPCSPIPMFPWVGFLLIVYDTGDTGDTGIVFLKFKTA
jgi:hypothetical protein